MFKKALYSLCTGTLCQATETTDGTSLVTRENGRMVRRTVNTSGKAYGARAVSYADAYFEFPFATMEIIGDEYIYENKT